ncbi:hypothetical protein CLV56_1202 [Mumia flava]|uniref:VOC domain-containing protein n=1 Tax=Mumia flava TaxID=1348852 RepID=A0A0B2BPT3_9ACTN|nr:VOC family protein [Mumia flava]PJJ56983.1 hypothetical protein CLV56_1202 [Mumia flava]
MSASTGAVRIGAYVLDCPDPLALAHFYAGMLEVEVAAGSDHDWAQLEGASLAFQRVDDFEPPQWPDGLPQQAHLDLAVASYDEPHRRALALGAQPLDPVEPPGHSDDEERGFRVYADPAGHPFCLCTCD